MGPLPHVVRDAPHASWDKNKTKQKKPSKNALKIIKHDNSGLSLIRGGFGALQASEGHPAFVPSDPPLSHGHIIHPFTSDLPSSARSPLQGPCTYAAASKKSPHVVSPAATRWHVPPRGNEEGENPLLSFMHSVLAPWCQALASAEAPASPLRGLGSFLLLSSAQARANSLYAARIPL